MNMNLGVRGMDGISHPELDVINQHSMNGGNHYDLEGNNNEGKADPNASIQVVGDGCDQYYKTKLCSPFQRGRCRKGEKCNFAHNAEELRRRLNLEKTKLCDKWLRGWCFSADCPFAHGETELTATTDFYKTEMCKFWIRDVPCEAADRCRHAHGESELRPKCSTRAQKDFLQSNGKTSSTLKKHVKLRGSVESEELALAQSISALRCVVGKNKGSVNVPFIHGGPSERWQENDQSEEGYHGDVQETDPMYYAHDIENSEESQGWQDPSSANAVKGQTANAAGMRRCASAKTICPPGSMRLPRVCSTPDLVEVFRAISKQHSSYLDTPSLQKTPSTNESIAGASTVCGTPPARLMSAPHVRKTPVMKLLLAGTAGFDKRSAVPVEINGQIIEAVVFYNMHSSPPVRPERESAAFSDMRLPPGLGDNGGGTMGRSFSMPDFNSFCHEGGEDVSATIDDLQYLAAARAANYLAGGRGITSELASYVLPYS